MQYILFFVVHFRVADRYFSDGFSFFGTQESIKDIKNADAFGDNYFVSAGGF